MGILFFLQSIFENFCHLPTVSSTIFPSSNIFVGRFFHRPIYRPTNYFIGRFFQRPIPSANFSTGWYFLRQFFLLTIIPSASFFTCRLFLRRIITSARFSVGLFIPVSDVLSAILPRPVFPPADYFICNFSVGRYFRWPIFPSTNLSTYQLFHRTIFSTADSLRQFFYRLIFPQPVFSPDDYFIGQFFHL